jgi:hypothetical protein
VSEAGDSVTLQCTPNHRRLGDRFGKKYKAFQPNIRALTSEQLSDFMQSGSITIEGEVFDQDDITVPPPLSRASACSCSPFLPLPPADCKPCSPLLLSYPPHPQVDLIYSGDKSVVDADTVGGGVVVLNTVPDGDMLDEAMAREVRVEGGARLPPMHTGSSFTASPLSPSRGQVCTRAHMITMYLPLRDMLDEAMARDLRVQREFKPSVLTGSLHRRSPHQSLLHVHTGSPHYRLPLETCKRRWRARCGWRGALACSYAHGLT